MSKWTIFMLNQNLAHKKFIPTSIRRNGVGASKRLKR